MEEQNIIKQILNGDIDLYSQLVERYHVGLIIYCEGFTKERSSAEDIAQESFITAYTKLSTYDASKAQFSTWLYKIACNKSLDHLRSSRHVLATEDIEAYLEQSIPDYAAEEEKEIVRSLVNKLEPPEYCEVIKAYYWQGESYQQISDRLDIPLNTVRTWLSRAKSQLRSSLV